MTTKIFLSTATINYFGFTMAVDYSIVLLSIEEFWKALDGNPKLYGFVFGSYALSQTAMSPLLGYISDVRGLKFTLVLSLLFNAIGNILYGLAFVSKSVNMVLIGRFISGLGAGALALGVVYLTNTSSRDVRGKAIASFKLSQAIGYLGGPLTGMALISLSNPTEGSSITTKIFNFYTAPAWLALGNIIIIVLPLVKFCFKNPLAPHMALKYNYREAKELVLHTVILMAFLFLVTACFWAITSDLFTIAFGQYHLFRDNRDIWKIYVSASTALALACLLVRLTIHRKMTPVIFTVLGLLLNVVGFSLLADYKIQSTLLHRVLYYSGVALLTSGAACFFTGIGTYYSQKVTDLSHQARNRRGFFLGLFNFAEGFGRLVGPTVVSLVLNIKTNYQSTKECNVGKLIPDGCEVSNINIVIPVLGGVIILVVIGFVYYHYKHGKCRVDISLLNLEELAQPGQGRMSFREEDLLEDETNTHLELTPPRPRSPSRTSTSSKSSLSTA